MDKLKDTLPLFSILLLLLGLTKLIAFYGFFHIDIVSFIDFTEIIQLQFTFFTVGFIFFTLISLSLVDGIVRFLSNEDVIKWVLNNHEQESEEKTKFSRIIKWFSKRIVAIIFGVLTIYVAISMHFSNREDGFLSPAKEDFLLLFLFITIISAYSDSLVVGVRRLNLLDKKYTTFIMGIGTLFLVMILVTILSRYFAYQLMSEWTESEITLVRSDTLKTSKNLIYVGKTKGYVFLYDKDLDQSKVIPTSEIKQIDFRPGVPNHKVPKRWRTETYHGPK